MALREQILEATFRKSGWTSGLCRGKGFPYRRYDIPGSPFKILNRHPAFVEKKGSLKVGSSKVRSKVRHFGMRSAI